MIYIPTVQPGGCVTVNGQTYQHPARVPYTGLMVRVREASLKGQPAAWVSSLSRNRALCCAPVTGDRSISEATRLAA